MSDSKCRVPASGSCAGFANQFHCSAASIASEHMWISRCQEKVNASRWGTDTISKGSQKQCVFQKDGNIEIQYLEEAPLEMLHDILWPCNLFLKVEKEKLYMAIKVQEPSGTAPKQVRNSPVSLCCSPSSTPSFFFFKKKKKINTFFLPFPFFFFPFLSFYLIFFPSFVASRGHLLPNGAPWFAWKSQMAWAIPNIPNIDPIGLSIRSHFGWTSLSK